MHTAEASSSERQNALNPDYVERMVLRRESLRREVGGILPGQAEIVWEVGCGHGHFLAAYAGAHPGDFCVGIDINIERVRRGERKRDRSGLGGLHFIRAEAKLFLEVLPKTCRFKAVYVLFPDPWPKKRHHKNRLMRAEFFSAVAQRMGAGAALYFRTDHSPYFEEVVETLGKHADWDFSTSATWPFEAETIFQKKAVKFQSLVARRR
jgi:tRNA (guanine-N7-)-methyltransferase